MALAYIPSWRLFTTPLIISFHYQISNITPQRVNVSLQLFISNGGIFPNPQDYIRIYNATPDWSRPWTVRFSIDTFNTVDLHIYPKSHPSSLHFTENVAADKVMNDSGWAYIYSAPMSRSIESTEDMSIEEVMELARTNSESDAVATPRMISSGALVELKPTPAVWSVPVNGGMPF